MAAPLTVKRNNYHKNKKQNDIQTPEVICNFIYELIRDNMKPKLPFIYIMDPCCGEGNLLKPFFYDSDYSCIGFDEKDYPKRSKEIFFKELNYLKTKIDIKPDIVLCNPPFNNKKSGQKLLPEVFIKKIFKDFGEDIPVFLFTPMGFVLNQRKKSKRWLYFRDKCSAKITGRIALPLDIFPRVEFHNEILLWNLPELEPFYWLEESVEEVLNGKE